MWLRCYAAYPEPTDGRLRGAFIAPCGRSGRVDLGLRTHREHCNTEGDEIERGETGEPHAHARSSQAEPAEERQHEEDDDADVRHEEADADPPGDAVVVEALVREHPLRADAHQDVRR